MIFEQKLKAFCDDAIGTGIEPSVSQIKSITQNVINNINQGDLHRWLDAFNKLPDLEVSEINLNQAAVIAKFGESVSSEVQAILLKCYQDLHPWRKGPFQVGDCFIDTEWQSNMKWSRLIKGLPDLRNRTVLDVGCGNGYYLMKMALYEPKLLLGIEPGLLQNVQFWSIDKYTNSGSHILPLKIQDLPNDLKCFDVVFSMGILYHRKSPIEHLEHLCSLISKDGHLVLETLIVDGDKQTCLVPKGRYAQMRNVWFLPSVDMLAGWLSKVGFRNVEIVDVSFTTIEEQRSTEWMRFHSLPEFLTEDQQQTVEGHPPPKRVIITCNK